MVKGKFKKGIIAAAALAVAAGLCMPSCVMAGTAGTSASEQMAVLVEAELPVASPVVLEGEDGTAATKIEELEDGNGVLMFAEEECGTSGNETVKLSYTKIVRHENWFTRIFSVEYGGTVQTAYCIEPKEYPPGQGQQETRPFNDSIMTKALYYSYGYPGYETVTKSYLEKISKADCYEGSEGAYILSHIMLSYLYDNESADSDAFKGISASTKKLITDMVKVLKNEWPDVPDASLALNITEVKAVWNKEKQIQETPVMKLDGHADNKIVIEVPEDSVMTKLSGDELSDHEAGAVDVHGGDEFYFTAPASKKGVYKSGDLTGAFRDFQPYIIQVSGKQDIMYRGAGTADSVSFEIMWENIGKFRLQKVSSEPEITLNNDRYSLEGAVYEVYDCEGDLVSEIITDAAGTAELILPYGEYVLKEKTAPEGYVLDETEHQIIISGEETVFEHEEDIIPEVPYDDTPQTGDELPLGVLLGMASACIAVMIMVVTAFIPVSRRRE